MTNRPVVVGVAAIQQKGNFKELDEALILMDKTAKSAVGDVGNDAIKNYIDEMLENKFIKIKGIFLFVLF